MFHKISTSLINWIILISIALVIIEIAFFNGGLVVSLAISTVVTYIGYTYYKETYGKILFWIGIVSTVITILNMIAVRFIIIVIIAYVLRVYYLSRHNPEKITPFFIERTESDEPLVPSKSLLPQQLLAKRETPNHPYPWQDVHIVGLVGDTVIDLTETFLPHDEDSVISVRHGFGNIVIYVPYELEVSIHHSTLLGQVSIFNKNYGFVFNETIAVKTENFHHTTERLKIMTSVLSGNLEVVRT
ncbi:cell wall-active antibiotics response protein LiaF [Bacillaceae bacterium W0354]